MGGGDRDVAISGLLLCRPMTSVIGGVVVARTRAVGSWRHVLAPQEAAARGCGSAQLPMVGSR